MKKDLDILIIEDVVQDAELISEELRASGMTFRTRRVETREEFLEQLAHARPDIVLSDFTLPTFDALAALGLLRKQQLDIPFILVTGTRSEEVAVECIREGAEDYILKASLRRLPTSITNALQRKAHEQACLKAELALRRSEEQYRLIAENTRDLICLIDTQGGILFASPSHFSSLGYAPEDLVGTAWLDLVHPEDHDTLRTGWEQARQTREARSAEVRIRRKNGVERLFESVANWILDQEEPQRAIVVSRDITRRKEAEEALRGLPRAIREAQEAERRRVAADLHDSVIQILSAVKFRVQVVEEKLADKDEASWRDALKAEAHLEKAIQEVRRISRNLRPSELDDLGLAPALRSLCSEFSERTGISVDLGLNNLPQGLAAELELHLYRIIQEALGNIEKHSRASHVTIELTRASSQLRARIRDNGRGFDPLAPRRKKNKQPGMGLVDMKERAAFIGGNYQLNSTPGTGTEILVEVPLKSVENSKSK
ncbi:MAG TPA: PAS domain S-box protein [Verrucomicrobiae bacterium]|nr:PAS domain S-box protein [Verrucomicrobiae bacterium]